jgi:large subunit ribosomal protein L4
MIELKLHDQEGNSIDQTYSFDESEIADRISLPLLHSVLVMYDANQRLGTVKSKSRAEVSGSSKKLYKQKGTGNARAGNKRTPIRKGGGHCFAKRPKDWRIAMPRAARRTATRMAILGKLQAGQVYLVDGLSLAAPKTSAIANLIKRLGLQGKSGVLAISAHDERLWKSCRNIPRISLSVATDLNASSILRSGFLIATKDAMDVVRKLSAS